MLARLPEHLAGAPEVSEGRLYGEPAGPAAGGRVSSAGTRG
ncbi:hypothetical protein KCH_72790 [Kitasatospora cheerisanensis KCTC 2395]|uniref:Uncharacterized protein n=1 Tax=Kitasatospora cheerisanensis KCTC 2395 TaxID=1348663 RepID=A0A066YS56_9ACTN|nr:hypothetical protein KCH_72790 [Kitasatospora cheerisanensis KCTC 2395]